MFVVTYRRSRPFKLANTSLGIEVIMFEDNRLNNDNNEKRLSGQMNKLMQLYICISIWSLCIDFSALWCSICRSRERHMLRQGENRLYSHPYKPVSWMFTHQGKNSDQRTITKQACRDESTVFLFFSPYRNVYVYIYIYIYIYIFTYISIHISSCHHSDTLAASYQLKNNFHHDKVLA